MAFVLNASSKQQSVKVHGSWFTFNPGQIKQMDDIKVSFLTSIASYQGFVEVSEEFADPSFSATPKGRAALDEARAKGIANRIKHLEWLKKNELESLRGDMDRANIKAETSSEYTPESVTALKRALEELKDYQIKKTDEMGAAVSEIEKLRKELEG